MDPCPFVRVLVGNLALRMPVAPPAAGAGAGVHPSTAPCYCKIRLGRMPWQVAAAPLVVADGGEQAPSGALAAAFHLSKADLEWFARKPSLLFSSSSSSRGPATLKVAVYAGRKGTTCGVSSGRLIGKATIPVDLKGAEAKAAVGEGRCSKPTVEVGVPHVGCAEDAAAFVALAAAVDLSMDACRLFSHKLRKELSHLRSDVLR
uniref:Uncharacterized protein n=1 Tax=Oryza barthii TaxID=65489 RepID=A0A0D3FPM1_9ORYZ